MNSMFFVINNLSKASMLLCTFFSSKTVSVYCYFQQKLEISRPNFSSKIFRCVHYIIFRVNAIIRVNNIDQSNIGDVVVVIVQSH